MKKKSVKNTRICPNCEEKFTPNHGKQIFCSDRCKVAHGRSKAKELGLVPASQTVPPTPVITLVAAPWVAKIEDFCNAHGITPEDLISTYKASMRSKKKLVLQDYDREKGKTKPGMSYLERRRNLKLNNKE